MDALEMLRSDHQKMKNLLAQIIDGSGGRPKRRIFDRIRAEFEAHARAEESVFYPTFARYDDLKGVVEESFRDHDEIRRTLAEIAGLPEDSDDFDGRIEDLAEILEQHVDEEEATFFPRARIHMNRSERERLGRLLEAARQEVPAAA